MIKITESFVKGYSQALNLYGTKKRCDLENSDKKDYQALRGDWENVGRSIRKETRKFAAAK